ncbi:YihY family inner membrane protein [Streptosporangium becharense]|uniref:YihY family inner membrane protein n=1 Tax=Streptosporangium becharense TaxID=1816182 RepID=A0A7W9MKB8_9ACTN|nr:YihY/virulence factor BrkB family protein [Streptosporangium becharense]MBB2914623.1 YihY family inner membrane protein [Streptosporangium becharense]MBB5823468.1 YihY family inner membrane protein [Streptosporangium becharense]
MNGEELSADHAWVALRKYGRWHLVRDSFTRFRYGDGMTNSRALAFQICLSIIPGAIALVGLSSVVDQEALGRVLELALSQLAPGAGAAAVEDVLADSHRQAGRAGGTLALWFGLVTALVSLTSAMAQVERGANRIYGVERDRPFHRKYGRALFMALTSGAFMTVGFVVMVGGGAIGRSLAQVYDWDAAAMRAFTLVRWPLGFLMALMSTSVLFRAAPRRRQPGHTWLAFGALVSLGLWTFFTLLLALYTESSGTFGATYGPLTAVMALLLWSFLSSMALFLGLAFAAQLEAVRAGQAAPAAPDPGPTAAEEREPAAGGVAAAVTAVTRRFARLRDRRAASGKPPAA